MAGPAYGVLDDFNRADENPLAGSWVNKVFSTDANLKLVSNQLAATSAARGSAYWNQAGTDEVFATYATLPTADGVGLWLNVKNPGTTTPSGYFAWWFPGSGFRIWRCDNGSLTVLAGYVNPSFVAGDSMWFRNVGGTLTVATLHAGTWTDQLSVADGTYKGGYFGVFGAADTTYRLDDFGGGEVPPSGGPRGAVLDNFNRADENPLSDGGAWTSKLFSNDHDLKLVSNQALATSAARGGAYWNAQTFVDSEAFVTIPTKPTADGVGVWLRATNPGTASLNGYFAWWFPGSGVRIWRVDAGNATALIAYQDPGLAAGDKLWFLATGTTLRLRVFHAGAWGQWIKLTDATYASGYIGIFGGADTTYRLDDFGGGDNFPLSFITSVTTVYALTTPATFTLPFIASATAVYTPTVVLSQINVPFIASATVVYAPGVQANVTPSFIASATVVYALSVAHAEVDLPFISSRTRVYGVFSLFGDLTRTGIPGNGGEGFPVILAPNGTTETATLAVSLTASSTLLELTGDSGLPDGAFVVQIDDEVLYVAKVTAGSYRIRRRGASNTTAASHTAGADVTWGDTYDMAVISDSNIAHEFTADIASSGDHTYPGWLICYDATQAYLGTDRYPMHVTEVLGVFDAGAGSSGTNRCDAAQPNAISTPAAVSDDCPAALSNPSRIQSDIASGDVAVVRFTNPEASQLDLVTRSVALQSWFGLKRVSTTDDDVTLTDPNGIVVDTNDGYDTFTGSVNGEWDPPVLGPGISPDTGDPTNHDVPYTSVTLPGADRNFTRTVETGWPICVLAVRNGTRRVPYWQSWDWRDYGYVYSGFNPDATFCQMLINRNGIIFASVAEVVLPGTQDIDGPDAVWDDGTYYFGASWYVAIYAGPYLVYGPSIGATPPDLSGGGPVSYVPSVTFGGGPLFPPTISVPPDVFVEGGHGGGINPPGLGQRFDVAIV